MWNLYTDSSGEYMILFIEDGHIRKGLCGNSASDWWNPLEELENSLNIEDEKLDQRELESIYLEENLDIVKLYSDISLPLTRDTYPELFI